MTNEPFRLTVIRKETFNSAHRLNNPNLSEDENKRIFGKCNYPNYHGHNYELEVHVTGEIDQTTGYVIDLKMLSDIIKKEVTYKFDHKNLNLDIEEFKTVNPTAENIVYIIYHLIKSKLDDKYDLKIVLQETEKNSVIYPAQS
jgi:6-pyruvoyltetrahydropterin/6-carboxytetrahydropterin synthase